ncbi:hypothetical protein [Bacillus arachidis]|uniref:Uncharacterized protein n=1 Tax=Bacillus arachidis TaxID=2819290 RepID=A0ABS3P0L4_9BACI|nr:hypothetical protein [Bacillus arachidis]MBO1626615.1 hypothetical protein [Bacillus arachidis]
MAMVIGVFMVYHVGLWKRNILLERIGIMESRLIEYQKEKEAYEEYRKLCYESEKLKGKRISNILRNVSEIEETSPHLGIMLDWTSLHIQRDTLQNRYHRIINDSEYQQKVHILSGLTSKQKSMPRLSVYNLTEVLEGLNLSPEFVSHITKVPIHLLEKEITKLTYRFILNDEDAHALNIFLHCLEKHLIPTKKPSKQSFIPILYYVGVDMEFDWENYILENISFGLYENKWINRKVN